MVAQVDKSSPGVLRLMGMSRYLTNTKVRAYRIVQVAVKSGALQRGPCELCGRSAKTDAHHRDQSLALTVNWLCRPCHTSETRANEQRRTLLAAPREVSPAPVVSDPDQRLFVDELLATLSDEERFAIKTRVMYGATLEETAAAIGGITRERARQICDRACRKILERPWILPPYTYTRLADSWDVPDFRAMRKRREKYIDAAVPRKSHNPQARVGIHRRTRLEVAIARTAAGLPLSLVQRHCLEVHRAVATGVAA